MAVALALVVIPASARAQDASRIVAVRIDDPRMSTLPARIEGQVSDLFVEVRDVVGPLESSVAARVARAHRLDADVVVWTVAAEGGLTVRVLDARGRRVFSRDVPLPDPEVRGSAALEAIAVIVRTAVSAIVEGQAIGEAERAVVSASPLAEAPSPAAPPAAEPALARSSPARSAPDPAHPEPPPARPPLAIGLGWQGAIDGVSPAGAHGVWLRAAYLAGPVRLGLLALGGVPLELGGPRAAIRVTHHRASLAFAVVLPLTDALDLDLGIQAGVALFHRGTYAADPDLRATDDALVPVFVGGLEARLVGTVTEWLSLSADLEVDVVLPPPVFAVQAASAPPDRAVSWIVPLLRLGAHIVLGD